MENRNGQPLINRLKDILNQNELRPFRVIYEMGPISRVKITRILKLTRAAVTGITKRLEEVGLIIAAQQKLQEQKIAVRIVSMPSWELFEAQSSEYRESVLPKSVPARLAGEAGVTQGWHKYVGSQGDVIGVDRFGASAPGPTVLREYGLPAEHVCQRALALLQANKQA